jgi:uncharacterized repeat protein (TIGR01451 family)
VKSRIHLALALGLLSTPAQRTSASEAVTDLVIYKIPSSNSIQVGQQVQFFLTLSNGGPGTVLGAITVSDLLPAGLQYVSNTGNGAYNPVSGLWTEIPGAAHTTFMLTITAQGVTTGPCTNTAAINPAPAVYTDLNLSNNTASATVLVTSATAIVGGATYSDSANFTLNTAGVSPIIGGASHSDSADFTLNTTGVSPVVGGASYADSGGFTLNTTGVSAIVGGAAYADAADFTLNTTGVSPIIGGASYSDSANFLLNTTGVSLVIGGASFADSIAFALDTGGIRPFSLTGTFKLAGGAFQFSFSNAAGASFSIFGTTNPAVPFGNWTFLGTATENAPGQFQFTDPQGSNYSQRFYRVTSP